MNKINLIQLFHKAKDKKVFIKMNYNKIKTRLNKKQVKKVNY